MLERKLAGSGRYCCGCVAALIYYEWLLCFSDRDKLEKKRWEKKRLWPRKTNFNSNLTVVVSLLLRDSRDINTIQNSSIPTECCFLIHQTHNSSSSYKVVQHLIWIRMSWMNMEQRLYRHHLWFRKKNPKPFGREIEGGNSIICTLRSIQVLFPKVVSKEAGERQ